MTSLVCILIRDEADRALMEQAQAMLARFGVVNDWRVLGAATNAEQMADLAKSIEQSAWQVIIAVGHAESNLPALLSASTPRPVLGVPMGQPTKSDRLTGNMAEKLESL